MGLDLTIGAVGAALIGALVSLIGLIISKEAKVSEFRQAWIDDLRSSLSTFLAHINALVDLKRASFISEEEVFDREQGLLRELNSSYYQIALRINSEEPLAKDLQKVMVKLSKVVKDEEELANYDGHRVEFIRAAASLLKAEWVRVKRGERVYRLANLIAGVAVTAFAVAGLWIAIGKSVQAEDGHDAAKVEAKPEQTITQKPL